MGTSTSKTIHVRQAAVPVTPNEISSYLPPSPPLYVLDDIKIPIACYNRERLFEDDGFDWSEILKTEDSKENGTIITKRNGVREGINSRAHLRADDRPVTKQQPPSVKRPIRSITLHGRSQKSQLPRQRSITSNRSPNLSRKSTPTGVKLTTNIDFDAIDRHAKGATKVHRQSYESLIQYLLEPIRSSELSEIKTARVLLVWLANQPLKPSRKGPDTSNPEGLLQMVANGFEDFASAYVVLCRQVGLPCVLIEGVSKPFTYTPSDVVTPEMDDKWSAVFCEGSWQFVHPKIICKSKQFRNEEFFNISLDDFFMPTPDTFIHAFYPDDEIWQLLPNYSVINSVEAFLKLPCIFPSFFKLGLKLENETMCVLSTNCGKCEVSFSCNHSYGSRLCLRGKLSRIDRCEPTGISSDSTDLLACVLCSRQNDRFCVEIRLPCPGKYNLQMFGGFTSQPRIKLCNFSVECKETLEHVSFLPFQTDSMMWGPTFDCDEAGLMVPSQMSGIIDVPVDSSKNRLGMTCCAIKFKTINLRFLLHPDRTNEVEFFAHLRRTELQNPFLIVEKNPTKGTKMKVQKTANENNGEDSFYADFIKCDRKEDGHVLEISVTLPHVGEFGLMITKRNYYVNKRKRKVFMNKEEAVCAYFLRAKGGLGSGNVHLKLARENMVSLIYGHDRNRLLDAIDKFRKINLSLNDGDMYSAEKWCEYLKHKADLNESIHRRNITFIDTTLRKVADYRYKAILHSRIGRVFHLRHQLLEIKSLQEFEPYLKQAANHLARVEYPSRPVHITMAAVLLIFGEMEKKIEDWPYIIKQLTSENSPVDPPLMRKIRYISEVCPTKNDSRKIITLLQQHKVAEIREANLWTTYFHLWAVKVMAVLEDTDPFNIGDFPENIDLSQLADLISTKPELMNAHRKQDSGNSGSEPGTSISPLTYSTHQRVRSGPDQMAFNTVFENKASVLETVEISEKRVDADSESGMSNNVEGIDGDLLYDLIKTGDIEMHADVRKPQRYRSEKGIQTDMD